MPEAAFELSILDKTIKATVQLPDQAIRPLDLLPILQGFSNAVVRASIPEGESVSCSAGCGACCRQIVPISETEAFFLAKLIQEIPERQRAVVLARFDEILKKMDESGLSRRLRELSLTDSAARHQIGMEYFQLGLACPFLVEESCGIHEVRPLSCREYLVTSPSEHCSNPGAQTVRMVPMPAKLSYTLFRFGDGTGHAPVSIIPLPMLLEFVANRSAEDQPLLPAPELFANFFRQATA